MYKKRNIAILGSTGSIGTQTLEVIDENPEHFNVSVLTANNSHELLIKQALKYKPNFVVIADKSLYSKVNETLFPEGIKVFAGHESIEQLVETEEVDVVVTAMVGFSGLRPTLKAIEAGKTIALANKETLVVAGDYITKLAREKGVNIYPIDSEHSAIFQCMIGEFHNKIEKIILTASGGPFRGKTYKDLFKVTKSQALDHPNWNMGEKISIDSATMMNKGLEVIEAKWLFAVDAGQIEVLIHPQSAIHSMVQFEDGSIKAQIGTHDMRLPIQFALSYPDRVKNNFERFNFIKFDNFSFEMPDNEAFPSLTLAFEALKQSGNMPCILNAANEIAVNAFLNEKISFIQIPQIIEKSMQAISYIKTPVLEDYFQTDTETRTFAHKLIEK